MSLLILFVLGAFIGSFLNVVAMRWGKESFVEGRSHCPHCGVTLGWWELIPIVSFVRQDGRCLHCGTEISRQYPLVEIFTGIVFATIFNYQFTIHNEFSTLFIVSCLLFLAVFSLYIVILVHDYHTKIIPNPLVFTSIGLSLVYRLLHFELLDFLAGPIIFVFFAAIWYLSRGRAMGFGDAKLGLSIGLLLGAAHGFSAIVLAFWLGAIASAFLIYGKGFTIRSEVPFAPFIIGGAWLSILFQPDLLYVSWL